MKRDKNFKLKTRFLEYYRILPIQKLAANNIARNEDTITDWKKADQDFSDQIDIAKSEWAKDKTSRVKSKEWLLERVMKDHFAERKELTGPEGDSVKVEIIESKNTIDE